MTDTTTVTPDTPLADVLRNRAAVELLTERAPDLLGSTILHTLHRYPVATILATEPAIAEEGGGLQRLLADLVALPATSRTRERTRPTAALLVPAAAADGEAEYDTGTTVWRRAEITVWGAPSSARLRAVVTAPDGREFDVPGFWDGGLTHRIRILPDATGDWHFRTVSDHAALHGAEGRITVAAALAGDHGPVRVADTFHFAYADGTVFRPVGTTVYAWLHQGEELERETLETLRRGEFSKVRMCVTPKSYTFNANEPADFPFAGSSREGFDYDTPNPAFWRRLEHRIDELSRMGIETDLILFHPYDRWGFATMEPAQDDAYVAYAVARLASFPGVWWSLANEWDLLFSKDERDWEQFAAIVQRDDPYGHLLSIHNWHEFYDHSRPWVTHVSVQWQDARATERVGEWRDDFGKPVVVDECAYEGNIDQRWGNISGQEMTRRFWEGTVRGGYVTHGETYLDDGDVLWWAKGGRLHGSSPARIGFLRDILSTLPVGAEPIGGVAGYPTIGIAGRYHLTYLGLHRPAFLRFVLDPGTAYRVELIDTWNMTVETLARRQRGRFEVTLPGREYLAIRLTREDGR